ncbi:MAG TPA: prepilin-type N-terminal cleavage/methylation domain-containing protein, partial [Opitutaceae bacterium]|nr:prepilin-type N-terminal cleavage/methylation domain-containing protein [Opitutaceae bacterium]
MKNHSQSRKGFTLVEIMIVVVIIGLLAAMAIPAFNKVRQASREKAITNNLRQLSSAAQQYMLEQGVNSVGYTDIVGTTTDKYVKSINTVAGEDYTTISISNSTTQISITSTVITV